MDIYSHVSMVFFPPVNPPAKNWKPCRCPISKTPAHQWQWECDSYAVRADYEIYHSSACGGSYILSGGVLSYATENDKMRLANLMKGAIRQKGQKYPFIGGKVLKKLRNGEDIILEDLEER